MSFHSRVPEIRRWPANHAQPSSEGDYVLYWMTSQRRPNFNFALQRAVEWARELGKPLLILEALRAGYPWACPRFHRFVMQGMLDHLHYFGRHRVTYYPYLEVRQDAGKGLLESLAERACVVVGDYFPCFFLPRMQAAVAPRLKVLFEVVDSNGLLPLDAAPKVYERAVDFRRFLQKSLGPHLLESPVIEPLKHADLPMLRTPLPEFKRWAPADVSLLEGPLDGFSLAGNVPEAPERGGYRAADKVLTRFWNERFDHYATQRSQPSLDIASGLSPYLHFGHISTHQVLRELADMESWDASTFPARANGSKDGAWGMSENAESFLDEIVTWREIGYNTSHLRENYTEYKSLPEWARTSLEEHLDDERSHIYTLTQLDQGKTYDPLWNAAQRQLREEGRIHNYMRMLWGKKVLEWTRHPKDALKILIELNNRYALDGRNPNSYSGIFWCFGRYDRPWPRRPIFGAIRYMSSDSTKRKFRMQGYLERWGENAKS